MIDITNFKLCLINFVYFLRHPAFSGGIWNWALFGYIYSIIGKKHLAIKWLSWLPYKSSFMNFDIFETLKDSLNTPPSSKFLEQRVHELVGVHCPPPPPDNAAGSKRLRSGKVLILPVMTGKYLK